MEYLYTVDETAKLLKVNRNMVYDLINTGHLRAIKIRQKKKYLPLKLKDF